MRKRIDWHRIDPLIKQHLPSLTIKEFTEQYAPETIPRTIGQRARKLGITPSIKSISQPHRIAISRAASKYMPTQEVDEFLRSNNGKIPIPEMASRIGWSSYAVRKRLRELDLPIIRKSGSTYEPPRSNRVDWDEYDAILKRELPRHTVVEFKRLFMPFASEKTIGKRAKKLGIDPHQYRPSAEHKKKIAEGVRQIKFTKEMDDFIKEHKDDMGQKEIAEHFGIDDLVIWRRMVELKIQRDPKLVKAAIERHRSRIVAASVKANKARFAAMSPEDRLAYRKKCSRVAQKAFKDGKIKPHHGIGQKMNTKKGGRFRTRSSWETKYAMQLDGDSKVISFEYEPFTIDYEYDGIIRCYTPDFLVEYEDHMELVEVKPRRFLDMERNPAKLEAGASYCLKEDLVFKVITEEKLFKDN
jgi:DNA-binding Lrp family transcriptional regulator